jgi:ABC-type oligopeptide transport system substrate-binding subunit
LHVKLSKRSGTLIAAGLSGAMLLSACGGGDDEGGSAEGGDGGTFSIFIVEPQNPLIPTNTAESEGHQVLSALFTGLIEYSAEGEVQYTGVAESIESTDNTTWTVALKDGWTFHDGTPVTAQSFVDAWNYGAYSPNAQQTSGFFANIQGYADLQAPTDAGGNVTGDPAATEMSGLRVVDDRTFEVTLSAPFAQFPITVGYNAFYPLPEAFFEDPEAAGTQPIGNGPFQATEEFVPGQGFTVTRYDDYGGEEPAKAESVEFRVYADVSTGYTDLQAGNLDVLPDLPPDALAGIEDELGDRFLEAPSSGIQFLGYPTYDARFSDPRVRQAFSMAFDRQAVADAIFNGSREPADSYIAPVVDGYREGVCEFCELDVERANQLLDEAGFDRSQPIDLWFNAGGGHEAWVEAIGNQFRENLDVEYTLRGDLEFAEYLPLLESAGVTGPFRLGWSMDYPSPQNYLEKLFATSVLPPRGSNYFFYENPEFDAVLQEASSAPSNEEAVAAYQRAEDILLQDMPIIPVFFDLEQAAHSEAVSDVVIDVFGDIRLAEVTVN